MKMTIEKCATCPFFRRTLASAIASGGNEFAGDCACPAGVTKDGAVFMMSGAEKPRPMPVADNRFLPHWCPMRLGDIVLTIGNRGST